MKEADDAPRRRTRRVVAWPNAIVSGSIVRPMESSWRDFDEEEVVVVHGVGHDALLRCDGGEFVRPMASGAVAAFNSQGS